MISQTPAQNLENEISEAQGSPKRVLPHPLNRTLIRNDHPQAPAQKLENEVSEAQGVTKKGFVSFSE